MGICGLGSQADNGGRGLRQGDPLSSYLFIMVADLMGIMMIKANNMGLVQSFNLNGGGLLVPFIPFADNSLFMMKAEEEGVENLRCILLIMETVTGLKVNWSKSSLSSVGSTSNVWSLAEVLECIVVPLPPLLLIWVYCSRLKPPRIFGLRSLRE